MSLTIKMSGVAGAVQSVRDIPKRMRRRAYRIALNAGGGELKRELQKRVPVQTGLLKQSIGVKSTVPDDERRSSVVVGARRGFKRVVEKKKRGGIKLVSKKTEGLLPPSTNTKYRNPTRYAHLVEKKTGAHQRASVSARGRAEDQIANKLRGAVLAYRA